MNKYKLDKQDKETKLYRIIALRDVGHLVKKGEIGGFVQSEDNLSQEGDAWVFGNARVSGDAQVYGDARVSGNARVYQDARVSGNAGIFGNAEVSGDAQVYGNAMVFGDASVYGYTEVYEDAIVGGGARVFGDAIATKSVISISGARYPITKTDNHLSVGCKQHTFAEWKKLGCNKNFYREELDSDKEYKLLKDLLKQLLILKN